MTYTITEAARGWVVTGAGVETRTMTAPDAERWVRSRERAIADRTGRTRVTTIEWLPQTPMGAAVVRAIVGTARTISVPGE